MLPTRRIRNLTIVPGDHPRGQAHVSAASGLVCAHGRVYVIADDEHHLAVFDDAVSPGRLFRIFPGDLPRSHLLRKRKKPDSEALVLLPASRKRPFGALLALGSGSLKARNRAALIPLDADAMPAKAAKRIDLSLVYRTLAQRFGELNVEGAFIVEEHLVLLHRRHKGDSVNAAIRYRLVDWLALIDDDRSRTPAIRSIDTYELGAVDGIPFGLTDGASLSNGGWIFSAVAEDTSDSYNDGRTAASTIGIVDARGRIVSLQTVEGCRKIEGVAVRQRADVLDLCLTTDEDDSAQPSQLLFAQLAL